MKEEKSSVKRFFVFLSTISVAAFILSFAIDTHLYKRAIICAVMASFVYMIVFKKLGSFGELIKEYKNILFVVVLLLGWMILSSMFNSFSFYESYKEMKIIFERFFIFFIIILFFYKEGLLGKFGRNTVLFFIMISFVALLFSGIFQIFFNMPCKNEICGSVENGLIGMTGNRNIFGIYMAIGAAITFILIFNTNNKQIKFLYNILLILFTIGLMFSYSRASWLFLFVFLISYLIIFRKNVKLDVVLTLLCIVFTVVIITLQSDNISQRVESLSKGNTSGRVELWIYSIDKIKEKPIFGYGIRNFSKNIENSVESVLFPHNFILEILYSLGIVGLLLNALLLFIIFKETLSKKANIQYIPFVLAFSAAFLFDHELMNKITLATITIFAFFLFSGRLDNAQYDRRI